MGLLRTRRGLGLVAFATGMAIACVLLGLWQLDRYEQRAARNDAVRAAIDAPPVPLESLVAPDTPAGEVDDGVEWRTVVVRGSFDPAVELTLRLRPVEGQSGVHALGLLVLEDGRAVLVDRGFLPTATRSTAEVDVPAADTGPVEVVGRVRLSEQGRGAGLDADADPPSIRFVDLTDLQSSASTELGPVWVERVSQSPSENTALAPVPPPRLSAGPSLIYAVQWFLFAVIAVVGFVVLARRDNAQPRAAQAPVTGEMDGAPGSPHP
jgi:cytochrome oxidase assembly protein ShyY1